MLADRLLGGALRAAHDEIRHRCALERRSLLQQLFLLRRDARLKALLLRWWRCECHTRFSPSLFGVVCVVPVLHCATLYGILPYVARGLFQTIGRPPRRRVVNFPGG